jgi:hypothetical protein
VPRVAHVARAGTVPRTEGRFGSFDASVGSPARREPLPTAVRRVGLEAANVIHLAEGRKTEGARFYPPPDTPPHFIVGPFLLQVVKHQAWRPDSLWVAADQMFRSVALALDCMVWPGLPGRGGTTVGATLACHKPKFATIPCSAWISMGAIRELRGPGLCGERGPAKVGTIARRSGGGQLHKP